VRALCVDWAWLLHGFVINCRQSIL
jgi:hypothetical protein